MPLAVLPHCGSGLGRGPPARRSDSPERLREAYPYALASVRTNVIDHLNGLDLAALADAVGSFGTAETGCYPRRAARRRPAHRRE